MQLKSTQILTISFVWKILPKVGMNNLNEVNNGLEPRYEKSAFCICENKDADGAVIREGDQRLCFHYIDSTIPLLSKSEISSL